MTHEFADFLAVTSSSCCVCAAGLFLLRRGAETADRFRASSNQSTAASHLAAATVLML
jgi:hypothetical protein